MAQLFRPGANSLSRIILSMIILVPITLALIGGALARSGNATGQDRTVVQPVPFSHQHHAGDLGIDCRFCHTGVETSAFAGIPPTHTCMTCHSQVWTNAAMLAPVREGLASGAPLRWRTVNALPDYVYFDHHAHVRNGVPCAACHGATRTMPLTRQAAPLTMQWCIDCHRDPADRMVMPAKEYDDDALDHRDVADNRWSFERISALHRSGLQLTDCSVCHR